MAFAMLRERIDDDYEGAKWPHHRAYFARQIKVLQDCEHSMIRDWGGRYGWQTLNQI